MWVLHSFPTNRKFIVCYVARKKAFSIHVASALLHHRDTGVQTEAAIKGFAEQWADKWRFVDKSHHVTWTRQSVKCKRVCWLLLVSGFYRKYSTRKKPGAAIKNRFAPLSGRQGALDGAQTKINLWIAFRMVMSVAVMQLTLFFSCSFLSVASRLDLFLPFHLSSF